jgi:hypothetical protein
MPRWSRRAEGSADHRTVGSPPGINAADRLRSRRARRGRDRTATAIARTVRPPGLWCIVRAPCAGEHTWKDLGTPRGRPCDWLVEADQADQDDPLTVHRPARTLLFRIFDSLRLERRVATRRQGRPLVDSSGLLVQASWSRGRWSGATPHPRSCGTRVHLRAAPPWYLEARLPGDSCARCSCGRTYGRTCAIPRIRTRSIDPERRIRAGRCTVSGPSWADGQPTFLAPRPPA